MCSLQLIALCSRACCSVSDERYATSLFPGKMAMLDQAVALYASINGGNVWGNPLVEYGNIGHVDDPSTQWNATLFYESAACAWLACGCVDVEVWPRGTRCVSGA